MKKLSFINITLFVMFILISCTNKSKTNGVSAANNAVKLLKPNIEDFDTFYYEFYSDTVFQKSRVLFPLPIYDTSQDIGLDSELKTPKDTNLIMNSEWQAMVNITENDTLKRKFIKSDTLIKEIEYKPYTEFETICTFKLINNKWYLTFFTY